MAVCGAKTKTTGRPCQTPVPDGQRCHHHLGLDAVAPEAPAPGTTATTDDAGTPQRSRSALAWVAQVGLPTALAAVPLAVAPGLWKYPFAAGAWIGAFAGLWWIRKEWPSEAARLEASIAAFGVALAALLLAVQVRIDDQRATDAERLQTQIAEDAAAREQLAAQDAAAREQLAAEAAAAQRAADQEEARRRTIEQNVSQSATLDGGSFGGADLSNLSIAGRSAVEIDLSEATLHGLSAISADLTGADLVRADGDGPQFDRAVLTGADVSGATMSDATFVGANLTSITATGWTCHRCDFSAATLAGAQLEGADLAGSIADRTTWWPVSIKPSDVGLLLPGGDARGLVLRGRDLRGVNLDGTDFTGADLRGARLEGATLRGVNLSDADLRGSSIGDAVVERAIIDDKTELDSVLAGMVDASSAGLELEPGEWNLNGLTIESLRLEPEGTYSISALGSTLTEPDFDGVNLAGSDFIGTVIVGGSFDGTGVGGVNFAGADLSAVPIGELVLTEVTDPLNGGLVIYDSETQLPPRGLFPQEIWFNLDAPNGGLERKLNWILAGVDAAQASTQEFGTGSDYTNFQSRGSDLRNLGFTRTNLLISDFSGSDLRGTTFRGANLVGAVFTGAALDIDQPTLNNGACGSGSSQFCGATYDASTTWPAGFTPPSDAIDLDGDLSGRNLSGTWLGNNSFRIDSRGVGTNFDNAFMQSSNWTGSELTGATFRRADATSIVLNGADLVGSDFTCTTLRGASFRGADLTGADFAGADLTNADFTGAVLSDGSLDQAIIDGALLPDDYVVTAAESMDCG